MIIKEYRIALPMTVEEYQVGQLFSVAEASKQETGGGEGVEIIKNEPYDNEMGKGQYTFKKYHLSSKVPSFIRLLAPNGALVLTEEAWNGYPHCKTVLKNEYMKENFTLIIESFHYPDAGDQENVLNLDEKILKRRIVEKIDIAEAGIISSSDYKETEDPAIFKSEKTERGPLLSPGWEKTSKPVMCCYKLVTVEFKWFGLQTRVENFVQKTNKYLLTKFHRQVVCWMDKWIELSMDDIRRIEDKTKEDLEKKIKEQEKSGTVLDTKE